MTPRTLAARCRLLCLLAPLLLLLPAARALTDDELRAVRFDQNLNRQVSLDTPFRDETGRAVTLGDFFAQGKPVLLVPGYYHCPMLCTLVADGMIEGLQELKLDIGRDFQVVHFSIDPRETPADALAKKQLYARRYGRTGPETGAGWHFLTGGESSIRRIAEETGFHFLPDPASGEFAHPSGFVLLTPGGKISRYFFGVNFSPGDLRAALLDAGQNRAARTPIEQLLLLCFHYNPATGKYSLAIMTLLRACGVATVLGMAGFIIVAAKKRSRADGPAPRVS